MRLELSEVSGVTVAEVTSDGVVVATVQDALDLIGTAGYQGAGHVLLHARQLEPAFFDLTSGLAGEVLQKFSNYRMGLSIVGDFDGVGSSSLRAFIAESNRGAQVAFVPNRAAALARLRG